MRYTKDVEAVERNSTLLSGTLENGLQDESYKKGNMTKHRKLLIGAEVKELDAYTNYQRTCELRLDLINLGVSFVGVTNVSSNKKCQMFLVGSSDEDGIRQLAKKYGQKAILSSDERNNTDVVSTKSNGRTSLGKLIPVQKTAAEKCKFYITFQEDGKEYFYVTRRQETQGHGGTDDAGAESCG